MIRRREMPSYHGEETRVSQQVLRRAQCDSLQAEITGRHRNEVRSSLIVGEAAVRWNHDRRRQIGALHQLSSCSRAESSTSSSIARSNFFARRATGLPCTLDLTIRRLCDSYLDAELCSRPLQDLRLVPAQSTTRLSARVV